MSAFDRFEFGFPVPGGVNYTPDDGEFLIYDGVAYRNKGPYMPASESGRNMLEAHVASGYCYRTGPIHYAQTWLGYAASRPILFDLLTNKN